MAQIRKRKKVSHRQNRLCNSPDERSKANQANQEKNIDIYREKINKFVENLDDNFLLGYSEAILNLLGEFTNGQCSDCPFSHEVESYSPDFIYPEYDLKCRFDECWIDSIKKLLSGTEKNEIQLEQSH